VIVSHFVENSKQFLHANVLVAIIIAIILRVSVRSIYLVRS